MATKNYKRLKGSKNLRLRLLLARLSSTPIIIDEIRSEETVPGLRHHEINLLRLFETLCDDCAIEINETGTRLKYKPGVIMGGNYLEHDCGLSRSIGYFLETLIVLCLFAKRPTHIKLKGITNDPKDLSVDTFRSTTLSILKRFGVPSEGLELKIINRGVGPNGGGEVLLSVPIVHSSLTAVNWIDDGMVKRIREFPFLPECLPSLKMQSYILLVVFSIVCFLMFISSPTIKLVYKLESKLTGYGISLVAETTSGCCISVDTAISHKQKEEIDAMDDDDEQFELKSAEDVDAEIASTLLGEIQQGGVVNSTHQYFLPMFLRSV